MITISLVIECHKGSTVDIRAFMLERLHILEYHQHYITKQLKDVCNEYDVWLVLL